MKTEDIMKTEWSLDVIYKGIEDPAYEADFSALEKKVGAFAELVKQAEGKDINGEAEALVLALEAVIELSYKLGFYLELRQAANSADSEAMAQLNRVEKLMAKVAPSESAAKNCWHRLQM